MSAETLACNAACISNEIAWFRETMEVRFKLHASGNNKRDLLSEIEPPDLNGCGAAPYANVVREFDMSRAERLVLILSYLPHVRPDLLDPFFIQNQSIQRRFTEFGGLLGLAHGGFLPTGETAMFLLAGDSIHQRLGFNSLFSPDHYFYRHNILRLNQPHAEEPRLASVLQLTPEFLERLTTGRSYHPPFSPDFPAQLLTTLYEWEDLVLDAPTYQEIEDIAAWVRHEHTMMEDWQLKKRIKPGFRSLFYGPPGTGKTLTACLLGRVTGSSVYRIDLSKIVSKYIGETEKNLAGLFDQAQHQNWILFFDEADALFGKRTESHSANDRAANQQISYLLQRIEDFPRVVILATNLRSHLDDAFARRFQSMIHFPLPSFEQRLRLWEDNFKDKPYALAADVNLRELAREYELAGGGIVNVLRYACLKAVARTPSEIRAPDLLRGIRSELHKEGKFLKQRSHDSGG
jgi:hypothetical protein